MDLDDVHAQNPTVMSTDPYQPPASSPDFHEKEAVAIPPLAIEHLRCTRPWVKFCSIAGYVTSGFLIVIAMISLFRMVDQLPLIHEILLGGFYLVLAILFFIPSFHLSRYEKSITHLTVSNRVEDLEQALADQRAFWKQMAIMILLLLIMYMLTISFSAIMLLSSS